MRIFFVGPAGQDVGLTTVTLSLTRALQRAQENVGFLKPIAQDELGEDRSTLFARQLLAGVIPDPIPLQRAQALIGGGQQDALLEEIVSLAQQAGQGKDVLMVEGLSLVGQNPYAHPLNVTMSHTLVANAVLVATLQNRQPREVSDQLEIAVRDYGSGGDELAGYIVNYVPSGLEYGTLMAELRRGSPALSSGRLPQLGLISAEPQLNEPRTFDVAQQLGAQVLNEGELRSRRVKSTVVSARSAPFVADLMKPGALVVAPGDRDDILMAASLAHLSGTPLAGLLLTSDAEPDPRIERLCQAALTSSLPVMKVSTNSYDTAGRLARMDPQVPLDDLERIERTLDFIADRLDVLPLRPRMPVPARHHLPPPAFRYQLVQKARAASKRIVLPEGDEPRTVRAAVICHQKGIARCVLLAAPDAVQAVADAQGITLPPDLEILDPNQLRFRYVAHLVELRRHKGLTEPMAEQQLEDNVVLGTMMLAQGEVDGLVSGAVHTTANTVRPALQFIKTAPGTKIVSSVFFMLMPDQVLVYGDCAINPNPTAQELADIAVQSADSAAAFGIEPRVAMISYSTGTSGSGEDVEKVSKATRLAREKRPDLPIDGPMQYDAASVASVGAQKAPGSPVAGRATVFIFPDLNTGNTTYKAVQRSAGVVSIGPMLQGLRKPVNDLSRGALVDDIVFTIAITAIQAQQNTPR
ncbi:phosphate acetyltransferase [Deinococcus yavapaiensis]|uniref:phosphate acetyltransferase n=1 Tax=Deinococcus yavapaiensis TaxID=309889 RepID=UPI000DA155B5|nr:phosphate acetyltransferase [Deinococcus yavapaiensis]